MSSKVDSDELQFVIGTIFSIREGHAVTGSHGTAKGRQGDVATNASWVN